VPKGGGRALTLDGDRLRRGLTLGRDADCDLMVDERTVSKHHARLRMGDDGRLMIEDLQSANGTFKGRSKISQDTLVNGDGIMFGQAAFTVEITGADRTKMAADGTSAMSMGASAGGLVLSGMDGKGRPVQFSLRARSDQTWTLGRKKDIVDFAIEDPRISSEHVRIRYVSGRGFEICDLGSTNGTKLDGATVGKEFVSLDQARKVTLGGFSLNVNKS
jgi:pSer/pThr/pTyr-binding forkhead associated (FHA) protein